MGLLEPGSGVTGRTYRIVKRAGDVVVSAAGLVVAAPLLAGVAIAVRRSMGPPVLFRQQRTGRDGVPFQLLKFRTMQVPTDLGDLLAPDSERLTPLGARLRAWSIDELPQLVNVLRGQMSLVGPRPLPSEYLERYSPDQRRRLELTPGLTGWAQVNGRNSVAWAERFRMDVWYVDHASLALDLRIIGRTLRQVLSGAGIAAEGHATMPEFRPDDQPPASSR